MGRIEVDVIAGGSGGSTPTGPAGGDLNGDYPNPLVNPTHSGSSHAATQAAAEAAAEAAAATDAAAKVATHAGLSDPHPGYVQEALFTTAGDLVIYNGSALVRLPVGSTGQALVVDTTLAGKLKWATITGGGGGVSDHSLLTGVTSDQHHPQSHGHASHTGIGANDHHNQAHALNGADHSGAISSAQHSSLASGDLHPEYVQEALLTAAGDLLYRDGSGVARLARGTNGQILSVNTGVGGQLAWIDPIAPGSGAPNTLSFITATAEAGLTNETPLASVQIRQLKGMSGVVNVADFGAVGTDTGDQTAAIQAAVDALPTSGGKVLFPTGRYRCLGTIHVDGKGSIVFEGLGGRSQGAAGATIVGRGGGVTLISCTKGGDPIATHSGHSFYNLRFEDSTVDDLTTNGVDATFGSGTITFTKSGHPFNIGDWVFTNRHTGSTNYRALKVHITAKTSTTFSGPHSDPGAASGTGMAVSLELLPAVSQTLIAINGQTRWYAERCAFFGAKWGLALVGSNDDSWGKAQSCTFDFCGVGFKIATTGGQSVIISGGNLLLKSGQVGYQGPDPTDAGYDTAHDDAAHFRAYGMKFDTQNCSGDGSIGFDLGNSNYFHIGPFVSYEMEGNCIGIRVGALNGGTGVITGIGFQHNETKEGTAIVLAGGGGGDEVDGVTIGPCQYGGAGWQEAIHIGPNTRAVKIMGGNVNSANKGVVIDNINDTLATLIDGMTYLDSGGTFISAPAGSDYVCVNSYDINSGWVGITGKNASRIGSSQTKASSTAFSTIPNFSLDVAKNAVYAIEIVLFYSTNSVADMQLRFNGVPTGGAVMWGAVGIPDTATGGTSAPNFVDVVGNAVKTLGGVGPGGNPGTSDLVAVIHGIYRGGANQGTLSVQWAQNVSDSGQSVLYGDSHIIARRLT